MEALARVKEALGEEAVILSSRRVKEGSSWVYEITAAVDIDPPPKPRPREPEGFSTILREIESIKEMLARLNGSLEPKSSFYYQLLAQEVPQAALSLFGANGDLTKERFLKLLPQRVSRKVGLKEFPRVQIFVGQGGVGKTTSAVKLAARYIYQGYRVALLSLDTVRVGAREQIDRFAALMEIPLHFVRRDEDLAKKVAFLEAYDHILIDTPALGAFFPVTRLLRLLQGLPEAGVHLVVRAPESPSVGLTLLKKLQGEKVISLILTHTEALTLGGSLFWILLPHVPPVSFISTGERVPEDFERATSRRLLGLLLRNLELEEVPCTTN
jgi:flagellar biosynthesis protein FlhF